MAERPGHIVELQSLRGLAAVVVMIGHSLNYYDSPQWFLDLALIFNGRAAVVVFFVLSGYVLTRSLRHAAFDTATVMKFYGQRLFRIYPAIWVASVLGLIYLLALHWRIPVDDIGAGVRKQFRPDRMDLLHIVASFAGMLAYILPQLWSIFVEIAASVAMPLIAFVTLQRSGWTAAMLAAAVLASYVIGQHTYYYVGLYFMDFVAGAALAMPRSRAEALFRAAPARVLVPVALIALSLTQFLPTAYYDPTAHLVETGLAAAIIGMLVYARQRVRVLASRPLVFVGDISYSIYLLHYVVLCSLAKLFAVLQAASGHRLDEITLAVSLACLTCLVTMPLAWLSYETIEKPGVRVGKLVLARLSVGRQANAPAVAAHPQSRDAAVGS